MSEKTGEQQADPVATEHEAAVAALPMVEAPAISPATESEPAPVAADATEPAAPRPSATERFRAAAAAQIEAARARLEKRNASSMVAMALIAGLTGAFGTAGLSAFSKPVEQAAIHTRALEDSIARLEDDIAALRIKLERSADLNTARDSNIGERFERIEKAQAEPAARLSKLTETVEKLRNANAASIAAAPQSNANDITGSVNQPPVPLPAAKPKPAAPTIVEGWALRELDHDVALIEGKRGLFEIVVGDNIPGLGRVEGFRKQDGRWVVVTAKGLIVSH